MSGLLGQPIDSSPGIEGTPYGSLGGLFSKQLSENDRKLAEYKMKIYEKMDSARLKEIFDQLNSPPWNNPLYSTNITDKMLVQRELERRRPQVQGLGLLNMNVK